MKKSAYTFTAKIWLWPGNNAAWHFVTVPKEVSEKIKKVVTAPSKGGTKETKRVRRGFGSVKVEVTVGKTIWQTSIFPDSRSGCYLLPIKLSARKAEGLYAEGAAKVKLTLV